MRQRRYLRWTSLLVLWCFVGTLCAPFVEAAQVVLVKVPGRNVMFDLNTANAGLLQSLPGIGPKTAGEIVKYRSAHGSFRSVNDLANVPGVGSARLKVLKSASTQTQRENLRMRQAMQDKANQDAKVKAAKAQEVQKQRVKAAQDEARTKAQAQIKGKQQLAAKERAKKAAQDRAKAQNEKNKAQRERAQQDQKQADDQKRAQGKQLEDAKTRTKAQQDRAKTQQDAKAQQDRVKAQQDRAKAQQDRAKTQQDRTKAQQDAKAQQDRARAQETRTRAKQLADQKTAEDARANTEARAAKVREQAQTRAKTQQEAKTRAQNEARRVASARAKGPAAPSSEEAPKDLWIEGPKTRVNINNPNTGGAAGALARAGFSNAEITKLLNARIQNGQFSEIKSYAELQGRLTLKEGAPVKWLDGQGKYVKPGAQRSASAKQARDTQQAKDAKTVKEAQAKQPRAKQDTQAKERAKASQARETKAQTEARKAATQREAKARALDQQKLDAQAKAKQVARDAAKQARAKALEAAPREPEITQSKGRTVVRVRQGSQITEIDLNNAPNASQLYKQLKGAGLTEAQAKDIATARIKGQFKNTQDLQARSKAARELKVAKALREPAQASNSDTKPAETRTAAKPAAPQRTGGSNLDQIEKQYNALASRKPTSEAQIDRTVKSLQETRTAMERAYKAAGNEPAGRAKLAQLDARVKQFQTQKQSMRAQSSVNQAKARLNTEMSDYQRQAKELVAAKPGNNPAAIDRQLRGLKQAYDGIYKNLDAQARLSGKALPATELSKDPRLAEIAKNVDTLKTSRVKLVAKPAAPAETKVVDSNTRAPAAPGSTPDGKPVDAAKLNPKAQMLAKLKTETEARARTRAPAAPSKTTGVKDVKAETAAKAKIADLQQKILKNGQYKNAGDLYKASQQANASGDVKSLGKAIQDLRTIRTGSTTPSTGASSGLVAAADETTDATGAPAAPDPTTASDTAAAPAPKGPVTREQVVKGKIAFRMAKILDAGQYSSPEDVYAAAQQSNASGDVKKLANALDELKTLRSTGQENLPGNVRVRPDGTLSTQPPKAAGDVTQPNAQQPDARAQAKAQADAQAQARAAQVKARAQQARDAAQTRTASTNGQDPAAPKTGQDPVAAKTGQDPVAAKPAGQPLTADPQTTGSGPAAPDSSLPGNQTAKVPAANAATDTTVKAPAPEQQLSWLDKMMGRSAPKTAPADGTQPAKVNATDPLANGATAKVNATDPLANGATAKVNAVDPLANAGISATLPVNDGTALSARVPTQPVAPAQPLSTLPDSGATAGSGIDPVGGVAAQPSDTLANIAAPKTSVPVDQPLSGGSSAPKSAGWFSKVASEYDPTFGAFDGQPVMPTDEGPPPAPANAQKTLSFLDKMLGRNQTADAGGGSSAGLPDNSSAVQAPAAPDTTAPNSSASNASSSANWADEYKQMVEGKGAAATDPTVTGDAKPASWSEKLGSFLKGRGAAPDPQNAASNEDYWSKFQETVGGSPDGSASSSDQLMARENELKLQAKDLRGKLVTSGNFKTTDDVEQAAQQPNAQGDLARLKSMDQEISSLRTQRQQVASIGDGPASDSGGATLSIDNPSSDATSGQPLAQDATARGVAQSGGVQGGASGGVPAQPQTDAQVQPVAQPADQTQANAAGASTVKTAKFMDWLTGKPAATDAPAANPNAGNGPAASDVRAVQTDGSAATATDGTAQTATAPKASGGGILDKLSNWTAGKGFKTTDEIAAAKTGAADAAASGVPPEVAGMRAVNDKQAPDGTDVSKLEDTNLKLKDLRAKAHDLTQDIQKQNGGQSTEDIQSKAGDPTATGKLKDLGQVNKDIQDLNTQKDALAQKIQSQPRDARGAATPDQQARDALAQQDPADPTSSKASDLRAAKPAGASDPGAPAAPSDTSANGGSAGNGAGGNAAGSRGANGAADPNASGNAAGSRGANGATDPNASGNATGSRAAGASDPTASGNAAGGGASDPTASGNLASGRGAAAPAGGASDGSVSGGSVSGGSASGGSASGGVADSTVAGGPGLASGGGAGAGAAGAGAGGAGAAGDGTVVAKAPTARMAGQVRGAPGVPQSGGGATLPSDNAGGAGASGAGAGNAGAGNAGPAAAGLPSGGDTASSGVPVAGGQAGAPAAAPAGTPVDSAAAPAGGAVVRGGAGAGAGSAGAGAGGAGAGGAVGNAGAGAGASGAGAAGGAGAGASGAGASGGLAGGAGAGDAGAVGAGAGAGAGSAGVGAGGQAAPGLLSGGDTAGSGVPVTGGRVGGAPAPMPGGAPMDTAGAPATGSAPIARSAPVANPVGTVDPAAPVQTGGAPAAGAAGGTVPGGSAPIDTTVAPAAGAPVAAPAGGAVDPAAAGAGSAGAGAAGGNAGLAGSATNGSAAAPRVVGPATDAISSLQLRNQEISNQLTQLEGQSGGVKGLFRRFFLMNNASKQADDLQQELKDNTAQIQNLQNDPQAAAKANADFQSNTKVQNALGQQGELINAYQTELAKTDPNSSYGKALSEKIDQLQGTSPETFASSVKNMFVIAAGTQILMNLGNQLKSGQSLDVGAAVQSVISPQFLVGTAGTAVGAYLGAKLVMMPLASLFLTRIGSFLPPVGQVFVDLLPAFIGGAVGGGLAGSLMGSKPDWALILSQTLGSALGTALAMSFFPGLGLVGQIAGGMLGGWVAEKILDMFRGNPTSTTAGTADNSGVTQADANPTPPPDPGPQVTGYTDADLQSAMSAMQTAYQAYLTANKSGDAAGAATQFQAYMKQKALVDAYRKFSFGGASQQAAAPAPTSAPAPVGPAPAVPASGAVK